MIAGELLVKAADCSVMDLKIGDSSFSEVVRGTKRIWR